MYAYYTSRALKFKVPKFVNIIITTAQIAQMAIGIYINYNAHVYIKNGMACNVSEKVVYITYAMYLSYLLLFTEFFYSTYLKTPKVLRKKDD